MAKVIEAGQYILPEGMTIERTGSFITIRPIIKVVDSKRCVQCKYCKSGRATANGFTTTICLLQPKNRVDRDGKPLYYHRGARETACERFEQK